MRRLVVTAFKKGSLQEKEFCRYRGGKKEGGRGEVIKDRRGPCGIIKRMS